VTVDVVESSPAASSGAELRAQLFSEIASRNAIHSAFVAQAIAELTTDEVDRFEGLLCYLRLRGLSIDDIADCYLTIVEDTLAEQMHFLRHKKYRCSTYAEVAAHVYHDRGYMNKYMYGLLISAFFWPNHLRVARFFRDSLPKGKGGRYLEVGPGHGYFMMTSAACGAFESLTGVDISSASVEQTKAIIEHFAPDAAAACCVRQGDFLEADWLAENSCDAVVMGEVIEHVEQPAAFLRRVAEISKPDAFIYVTTCINAPAVDHIYLWRSPEELEQMIRECGLSIESALRLPYEGLSLEQTRAADLPIVVAYVLRKA
jgi:ubiquinone/menaquinone biosynthesis C-methylase UbiE